MLNDCTVVFDGKPNGVYYAGENVTGLINLILSEPQRVTDLIFQSKGTSRCKWTRHHRKATITFSTTENHYKSSLSLLIDRTRDPEQENTVLLEAGTHEFPFSFTLPDELPTSYENTTGHVRYTIKVKAISPQFEDEKYKMAFTVISKCDLNCIPKCNRPVQKESTNSFSTCCINQGAVQMTISLPMSGFLPGQHIPITCSIKNYSKIAIKEIAFAFRKIVVYTAHEPYKKTKLKKEDIVRYVGKGVAAMTETFYKVSFPVPAVPPSTIAEKLPIKVEYELKVTGIVSLFHYDPEFRFPLVIGNIPFHSLSSHQEPALKGGVHLNNQHGLTHPPEEPHESDDASSSDEDLPHVPEYPVFDMPPHPDVLVLEEKLTKCGFC